MQEEVDALRVKLAQDKLRAKEDELIAELKKSVKVEIDEAALQTVKVNTGSPSPSSSADAGR